MTDTNPLPPLPEPEGVIVVGTQALRAFTAYQMRTYALQAIALRPVQVPMTDDVAQDAQRYRWLRRKACVIGKTTYCGEETGQPILDFVNLPDVTEVIRRDSATTLDAAIDAAMLAAQAQKGQP